MRSGTTDPDDRVVTAVHRSPGDVAVLTDFDGTLAEIVADPADARPVAGAVEALVALAERGVSVGVISGRSRAFLTALLPPAIDVVALYGIEWRRDGTDGTHVGADSWTEVADVVAERARSELPADVGVEPKGPSLTIHFRSCPHHDEQVHRWATGVARETGLEVRVAKQSVELHPPIGVSKGTAVTDLAGDAAMVVFLGDDRGDLDAFDALDVLADRGRTVVRIAVDSAEAPGELIDRADLVLDGPPGVAAYLGTLSATGPAAR
jgi:trehalose 6-phosphate phosphatase